MLRLQGCRVSPVARPPCDKDVPHGPTEIDLDELAKYVVITSLRRRQYLDLYEAFSHQLLLRMQAAGVKTIDVGDYTIRLHAATNRKDAACYQCGHLMGDNNQPPRITIKKKDGAK